jgi:pimeloyl-ACP methyl ester carboxylesterase
MMHPAAKDIQMAKDTHITAPTRFVEAGAIRYAYRRFGSESGTPLVFLQHFRGGLDNWDPLVTDALAQGRPVILFNNAGVVAPPVQPNCVLRPTAVAPALGHMSGH